MSEEAEGHVASAAGGSARHRGAGCSSELGLLSSQLFCWQGRGTSRAVTCRNELPLGAGGCPCATRSSPGGEGPSLHPREHSGKLRCTPKRWSLFSCFLRPSQFQVGASAWEPLAALKSALGLEGINLFLVPQAGPGSLGREVERRGRRNHIFPHQSYEGERPCREGPAQISAGKSRKMVLQVDGEDVGTHLLCCRSPEAARSHTGGCLGRKAREGLTSVCFMGIFCSQGC